MDNSELILDADDAATTAEPATDGGYDDRPGYDDRTGYDGTGGLLARVLDRRIRRSDEAHSSGVPEHATTVDSSTTASPPSIVTWHALLSGAERVEAVEVTDSSS